MKYSDKIYIGIASIIGVVLLMGVIITSPVKNKINFINIKKEITDNEAEIYAKLYIKSILKEPKSLEVMNEAVVKSTNDRKRVLIQYKAKNSFGGYVVEMKKIEVYLKNGKIYSNLYKETLI